MTLRELLEEAEKDEMKGVKWKHSRLKSKLVEYRHYMFQNYLANTITNAISKIKTVYMYNRVDVPFIPPLNSKFVRKNEVISF